MQTLSENQLYAKLRKCSFYKKQLLYLCHIISREGVKVDPKNIKAIQEWPTLQNVIEVKPFMGLTGYYRKFIEAFSRIANPITSLQNKGIKFLWTPECKNNFHLLKELLTSAPVLHIVDHDKEYVVYTDASLEDLGGVLI